MRTYNFLLQPWDGTPNDKFIEPIRAVNDTGAWEKAQELALEKQCSILTLILCK